MKVRTLLFAATLALVGTASAYAQSDVTSTYLTNSDFSQGTPVTMDVCGYQKDAGGSLFWAQDVDGWTVSTTKTDGNAGGLFAYGGSPMLRGANVKAPEAGPDGGTGNALGFFAVWGSTIQYTQQAKTQLAPGQYTLTYTYYNGSGTGKTNNRIGFIESNGTTHYCAVDSFAVGAWTTESYTFGISAATSGEFSLGYQSQGSGSGANPMLFIDNVKLSYTAVVVKDGLKTAIDNATETNKTLNSSALTSAIATAQAVYDNASATQNEVSSAITTLNAAVEKAKADAIAAANAENPLDMSSYITNSSYASNNNTGWAGDAPGFQSYTDAEFYNRTYNYYQVLKNMPKGVYGLSLQGFYRPGSTDDAYTSNQNGTNQYAKLFAQVTNDTITAPIANIFSDAVTTKLGVGTEVSPSQDATVYVPNNMQAAEEYFNQGKYNNSLIFSVAADSTVIGLQKTTAVGNDWTIWDNWGLKYYGNGKDAYTMWMKSMVSQTPDYSKLSESTLVTTSMVDAYNAAKAGYTEASTEAEVLNAFKALTTASDSIETNIALWKSYQDAVNTAREQVVDDDNVNSDEKDILSDYVDGNADRDGGSNYVDLTNAKALSNEEIRAEIAWVTATTKDAIDNGIAPGTDVTSKYLVNADFEKTSGDGTGWTVDRTGAGNVRYGGNNDNHCFEAWNSPSFDIHQEVKNAPAGVYTISVQGFYRYGSANDQNYARYQNGEATPYQDAVKVYVNDNTASFANVYDIKTNYGTWETAPYSRDGAYVTSDSAYWYANSMSTAATMFKGGYYKTSSYGIVAHKGDPLRIGVKGSTSQLGTSWAIWDNFQMVFEGTDADVVKPLLEAKIAQANDSLNNSASVIGTEIRKKIQDDVATAQTALDGGDGQTMFTSLSTLISDLSSRDSSIAVFDSLAKATDNLSSAIAQYSETAEASALQTASDLFEKLQDVSGITTDDARNYVAQATDAAAKLRIPGNYKNATEDNPVDFTSAIVNPNFEAEGSNSFDGWTDFGPNNHSFGNSADQQAALLVEYYNNRFNMNQTIANLPDGYYRVQVNGFYRYGSAADDYKHVTDGDANNNAYIYAIGNGTDSTTVGLALLGTGAKSNDGETGTAAVGTGLVVPNTMGSAHTWFQDYGQYVNSLIVNVVGGKLTIGVRHNTVVDQDWVIFDTWKLAYLGTSVPTGIRGITTADDVIGKVVSTEVYNLSGARLNGLQKGVNIVKVKDAQGKTSVKKVIVK